MGIWRFLSLAGVCIVLSACTTGCSKYSHTLKSAERGDVAAQYELGNMYYFSEGIEQSDVEAAKWWRKAAEQGHMDAQYWLAWLYSVGWGVEKDLVEAERWFRRSAAQGHSRSPVALGSIYTEGEGVGKDYIEAYFWRSMGETDMSATKLELEQLAIQMSEEDLAEAKRRVAEFKPKSWEEVQREEREGEK